MLCCERETLLCGQTSPRLEVAQTLVKAVASRKLFVGPDLRDLPFFEDYNAVGIHDRRETVSDHENRAAAFFDEPVDRLVDLFLRLSIERARRFIEDEDARALYERTSDRDALTLTTGETYSIISDHGSKPFRERIQKISNVCLFCSPHAISSRRFKVAHPDVLVGFAIEEREALRNGCHQFTPVTPQIHVRKRDVVYQDPSSCRIILTCKQTHERRLAATSRTNECDYLVWANVERDALQDGLHAAGIVERHVIERNRSINLRRPPRVIWLLDLRNYREERGQLTKRLPSCMQEVLEVRDAVVVGIAALHPVDDEHNKSNTAVLVVEERKAEREKQNAARDRDHSLLPHHVAQVERMTPQLFSAVLEQQVLVPAYELGLKAQLFDRSYLLGNFAATLFNLSQLAKEVLTKRSNGCLVTGHDKRIHENRNERDEPGPRVKPHEPEADERNPEDNRSHLEEEVVQHPFDFLDVPVDDGFLFCITVLQVPCRIEPKLDVFGVAPDEVPEMLLEGIPGSVHVTAHIDHDELARHDRDDQHEKPALRETSGEAVEEPADRVDLHDDEGLADQHPPGNPYDIRTEYQ